MSQQEKLREALLEIEVLRDRERTSRRESEALLDILRATTAEKDPEAALQLALGKTADAIGADIVGLAHTIDNSMIIDAISSRNVALNLHDVDPQFFAKPRHVLDASQSKKLQSLRDQKGFDIGSWLSAPTRIGADRVQFIFATHSEKHFFSKDKLDLLKRVIDFAEPALRNLELSSQNALLAAVIDGSSSSFAIADATDPDLPLVFVNRAFQDLTGYSAEDVLGRNCRFLAADDVDNEQRTKLRHAVKNFTSGQFLLRNRRKDGTEFWNELTLFPVRDSGGQVTQLVATQTDASGRVEAELDRKTAQTRLQDTLSHTNDAFLMVLKDGTVGLANQATRDMFNAGPLDWRVGTSFKENWKAYLSALPKSVQHLSMAIQDPDLQLICDESDGIRMNLPDGRQVLLRGQRTDEETIVLSATDTTAIRNTERLMRQKTAAVENSTDGVGILDDGGRLFYVNGSMAKLLGYTTHAQLLGRRWKAHYDVPIDQDKLHTEIGVSATSEILQLKSGDEPRKYHEITLNDVDKVGTVLVIRDVTSALRNRNRVTELNKQIENARRREAISTLAAGLAHDFNNVLAAVSGSATLIATDRDVTPEIKEHADRISAAGVTAARLVNRMLDLASNDDDASVFDLRSVMSEVQALAAVNVPKNVAFTLDGGPTAQMVKANVADITLVVLNLVINAADALRNSDGEIHVQVERGRVDPNRPAMVGYLSPNQSYANISVRDTGEGIPEDILPNVMQSYFTTKGSQGTGAGLAMVAAIVKRLDGAVFIDSAVGQGTTIDVYLPLVSRSDTSEPVVDMETDLNGMAILVLDDQIDVANVTAAFLNQCGAEASVLDDPELALEVLTEDLDAWSALVTDYDMPNLSGADVVEKIREMSQDFPIFVVTALARRLADPRINKSTVQGVFAKPINLGQLVGELKRLDSTK